MRYNCTPTVRRDKTPNKVPPTSGDSRDHRVGDSIAVSFVSLPGGLVDSDETELADFPELVDPHLAAIVGLTCFVLRIEEFELQNRLVNN